MGCVGVPVADAGPDVTVGNGATVALNGSNSKDPDGDPLTFNWVQLDGPTVMLDKPQTATPSFVVPVVMTATPFTFQLAVSDGKGSSSDTVVVTVDPSERSGPVLSDEGCGCVTVGSSSTNSVAAFSLLGILGLAASRLRRHRI
jgi:MYXO-CTERM domain-containing protein